MIVKLSREKVKNLINQYYKDIYNIDGEVIIKTSKKFVDYGLSKHQDCSLNITYNGKTIILGEETSISIDVSNDELGDIINYYLEQDGYSVNDINIDKGVEYKTVGYGVG